MGDKFSGRIAQAVASQLKHRENGTQNLETQIGHVAMLANAYLDQQTPEVLDWPNEPGWWWMQRRGVGGPVAVRFDGKTIMAAGWEFARGHCESVGDRFIRANVPVFPAREE